jgi:hypothetical protein
MQCCIAFQNILIRRCSNSWNWSRTSSNVLRIASTLSLMQCCIAFQNILIRRCRNIWNWSQTSSNRSLNWVTLSDVHRVSCQRCSKTTKRNKTFESKKEFKYIQPKDTPTAVWFFLTNKLQLAVQRSRLLKILRRFPFTTKNQTTYNNKRRMSTQHEHVFTAYITAKLLHGCSRNFTLVLHMRIDVDPANV